MVHSLTILKAENESLRNANKLATQRRQRRKRRIQQQGTLSIQNRQDLIDQSAVEGQILQETRQSHMRQDGAALGRRRCGRCHEVGHRIETCPLAHQDTIE